MFCDVKFQGKSDNVFYMVSKGTRVMEQEATCCTTGRIVNAWTTLMIYWCFTFTFIIYIILHLLIDEMVSVFWDSTNWLCFFLVFFVCLSMI